MEKIIKFSETDTYKKVLKHRHNCPCWLNNIFCFDCMGGGLTQFTKHLFEEIKEKNIKLKNIEIN